MHFQQILDKKTGQLLIRFSEDDDIESVNPIKYFGDFFIVNKMVLGGIPLDEIKGEKKPSESSMEIFNKSIDLWLKKKDEILKTQIPVNLLKLLETNKKNDQVQLLKGIEITPAILLAFIIEAYGKHGFNYSQYKSEFTPNGIDATKMPYASEIKEDGDVKIYGKTELSKGQIKQVIQHRKVTVGKIIEKGDIWHCFFANYKSLNGDEIWLGKNQPHFHYISNAFGLTREELKKELKSKTYSLGNVPHIKLLDYGRQPE